MNNNIIRNVITLPLFIVTLTACLLNAVKLEPGAELVKVGKQNPGGEYTEVGPVFAENGSKCTKDLKDPKMVGSYESALNSLKNTAAKENIDYVKIISTTEPGYKFGCMGKLYTITGTGYRLRIAGTRIKQLNRVKSPSPSINAQPVISPSVVNKRPVSPEPEVTITETNGNSHQLSSQLRELHDLKKEGIISEKEYQKLKDKIIDRF